MACQAFKESDNHPFAQYKDFSRRELPRLVRSRLEAAVEEHTHQLEEGLMNDLVDIVRRCQEDVFQAFGRTSGTMKPPTHQNSSVFLDDFLTNLDPPEDFGQSFVGQFAQPYCTAAQNDPHDSIWVSELEVDPHTWQTSSQMILGSAFGKAAAAQNSSYNASSTSEHTDPGQLTQWFRPDDLI